MDHSFHLEVSSLAAAVVGTVAELQINPSFRLVEKGTLVAIQIDDGLLAIHSRAAHFAWVPQISFKDDAKMEKAPVC
jgi:hypothetical protein